MTRPLRLIALSLAVASLAASAATAGDRHLNGHASGTPGFIQYTGQATHLGPFARTEYFFLDGADCISGTMVLTVDNGDLLYVDFDGQFISSTTAVGTYESAGGTGRFADAEGTATFVAVLGDLGRVEVDFGGTIRY